MELEAGTVVANRYRIVRPLGRGGMGEVFAAENIRTGRPVAVKLLRADTKSKSSAIARFKREALAAGKINSDHVTQVLDVDDDADHGIVLVFELLEGESLIDRLKRTGPIPFDELHGIIEQVWIGLADAHRAGVIHRDLKPSNVFLEQRPDGSIRVKILDFGISKLPKEMGGETLTEMGQSLGTFSFMPPEQIGKAKTVDHRADIYACTTMIYQAMTGHLPYQARNILVMVELKTKTEPRRLSDVMGGPIDPRLEAFLARGLAREPSERFQTALEGLNAWRELRPAGVTSQPSSQMSPPGSGAGPRVTAPTSPRISVATPAPGVIATPVPPHISVPMPGTMHTAPMPPQMHAGPQHVAAPATSMGLGPGQPQGMAQAPPAYGNVHQAHARQTASPAQLAATASDMAATLARMPPSEQAPQAMRDPQHAQGDTRGYGSGSYDAPRLGRQTGPHGTAMFDPNASPAQMQSPQSYAHPQSAQAIPRVFDEPSSTTGPASQEKTRVYRPQSQVSLPNPQVSLPSPVEQTVPMRPSPFEPVPVEKPGRLRLVFTILVLALVGFGAVAALLYYTGRWRPL